MITPSTILKLFFDFRGDRFYLSHSTTFSLMSAGLHFDLIWYDDDPIWVRRYAEKFIKPVFSERIDHWISLTFQVFAFGFVLLSLATLSAVIGEILL